MFHRLSTIQKIVVLLLAVGLIVALLNYRTVADTIVGLQVVNRGVDLEDGLIGHWTFDPLDMTPTTAIDRGSQENDGTFSGFDSVTTDDGVLAKALLFDGVDSRVQIKNSTLLHNTTQGTVCAWVKTNTNSGTTEDAIWSENISSGTIFMLVKEGSGLNFQFRYDVQDSSSVDNIARAFSAVPDTWHFVCGMHDNTGVTNYVRLYVDGVLRDENDTWDGTWRGGTIVEVILGDHRNSGTFGWDGFIDDVRIYNRALSEKEIQELYDIGNEGRRVSQSTTLSGGPDLERGLVGHWTFDGKDMTQNVADRSGQGNHGNLVGQTSTTTAPGVIGQALEFDGSDDYVGMGNQASLEVGTSDFSGCSWIKTSQTTKATLFGKRSGSDNGWLLFIQNSSGRLTLRLDTGSETDYSSDLITYDDDNWHHVCVSADRSANAVFYLDGIASGSADITAFSGDLSNANQFTLGANGALPGGDPDSNFLNGTIDDVRIYNRALSPDEISRLYDLGKTTHIGTTVNTNPDTESGLVGHWTFDGKDMTSNVADRSGQGNHGNLFGQTSTTTAPGVIGQALEFDGSDDYVDISNTSSLQPALPATLIGWVYLESSGTPFGFLNNYADNAYYGLSLQIFSGNVSAQYGDGDSIGPGGRRTKTGTTGLVGGRWYHIAGVIRGATDMDVYVNGVDDGGSYSGTGGSLVYNGAAGSMGRVDASNFEPPLFFDGKADDFRLYNRALSASEVQRLYELGR